MFVNRQRELALLEEWWESSGPSMGLVWGRRRVGKTALLQQFAADKRVVFHTAAGRPVGDELRLLTRAFQDALGEQPLRDLTANPLRDWDEAFEVLARAAQHEPLLLVLDELPELLDVSPELEGVLRAAWDRVRGSTKLRILLAGSAMRTMEAIQEERSPLYGRLELTLLLTPFAPHQTAEMLPRLAPADRALVWGIVGGIPLYLEWWNDRQSVRANLEKLVCTPGGLLLSAGEFALAADVDAGDLGRQVLYAIAAGRTKHNEIADAVRADPTRVLDRLVRLGIVDRMVPVTADPRRTRLRLYRVVDNFFAFWLQVVDRYRTEIERGLGRSILTVMLRDLDDFMGPRWEEAFRLHLRRMADAGELGDDVVAVGRFWTAKAPPVEIDAVVLAGRNRAAAVVGEAKWAKRVDGAAIRRQLESKAEALPRKRATIRYAVCAREEVRNAGEVTPVTAVDIFG